MDTETGRIDLKHVLGASDVGQIIDPPSLEGQIHGSLGAAGTDTAIFEESTLDRENGRLMNTNMVDYKWRTFMELPRFEKELLESPFPTRTFGAIGFGEISTAPGPGAVLMAVSNALGRKVRDYPVTPEVIFKAMGRGKGGKRT